LQVLCHPVRAGKPVRADATGPPPPLPWYWVGKCTAMVSGASRRGASCLCGALVWTDP